MFSDKLRKLLRTREFLSIATADKEGQPNAVPKFLLKFEEPHIYLIDYTIGQSVLNLRSNPRASLSLMDVDNLEGYRLNGIAEIIENGEEHKKIAKELDRKSIQLSATRVIEGMRTGKKHEHYELEIPDKFVAVKVRVHDVVKIGARGDLFREQ